MTTLELYSVYERGLIMMVKDLKRFLENQGYLVGLNNPDCLDFHNYSISLKSVFCHQYENDSFISKEMPEESDAFTYWFQTQYDSGFPIMTFELFSNRKGHNPIIEIQTSAYLSSDNESIYLTIDFKSKQEKWELKDWKKQLFRLTQIIMNQLK